MLARAAVGDVEVKHTAAAAPRHQIVHPLLAGLRRRPVGHQQPSIGSGEIALTAFRGLRGDACPVSAVVRSANDPQLRVRRARPRGRRRGRQAQRRDRCDRARATMVAAPPS